MGAVRKYREHFYCKKVGGPAYKYEVGSHVVESEILWVSGPFRGGESDIKIAEGGLLRLLTPGELVIGDMAYSSHPTMLTVSQAPAGVENLPPVERLISKHRQKIENLNGRLKDWKILKNEWRGTQDQHQMIFTVICKLLNIDLEEVPIRARPANTN
jgi:hypothetical protein